MKQSPDAPDATYRNKKQEQHHGLQVFVAETCHPDNPLQLINDIAVYQNNVDDTVILNERVETITEKTPDLSELHTDGAFGNKHKSFKVSELKRISKQNSIQKNAKPVHYTKCVAYTKKTETTISTTMIS